MTVDYMPLPGTPLEEIDTPALIVDLDAAEANIKALQDWCDAKRDECQASRQDAQESVLGAKTDRGRRDRGLRCKGWRSGGDGGRRGVKDILIANQIVGPIKIPRLVALAHQATIGVVVDDADNVRDLSDAASRAGVEIGVFGGHQRTH